MDRKEKILGYIKSESYIPLRLEELAAVLCVPQEDMREFSSLMEELCREGLIYISKKKRYLSVEKEKNMILGTLKCSKRRHFGFVIPDDPGREDVYIPAGGLGGAFDGDKVLAAFRPPRSKDAKPEGEVRRVISRGNICVTGVIKEQKNGWYRLVPDNKAFYAFVRINADGIKTASAGDRVAVIIDDYGKNGRIYGHVDHVFGAHSSARSLVEGVLYSNAIPASFGEDTLAEAQNTPTEVTEAEIKGRLDLRDKLIITIDGDDARDFDDAVCVERLDNGLYRLGVHIADVTHYVREGSALDKEAFSRGTSVYIPDRVIPMLPVELSNGICSLNPDVDRLTLSVIMDIDKKGVVRSHTLEKSVIHSRERMTYNNVTALLSEEPPERLTKQWGYLIPELKLMEELAEILANMRKRRGALNFDFPELEIFVDEDGEPVSVAPEERSVSHRIIEQFMLTANETVAEYACWSELPFVYRVHEPPAADKISDFISFIHTFGLTLKGKIDGDSPVRPKALQAVLEKVAGMPEERIVSTYLLHSLAKADYRPQNGGHFGLAAQYYCHFTSPIRRYPDLAIHRILKENMDGLSDSRRKSLGAFAQKAAVRSTEREIAADTVERDVDDILKTVYMSKFIGETFPCIISGLTSFGIFVELENGIEGMVRLDSINDDFYVFDEQQMLVRGERRKQIYRMGDALDATLVRADVVSGQLEFVFAGGKG